MTTLPGHPGNETALPLEGVLVVSVEQAVAAPLASCRLADLGARVIKVERPEGDFARGYDKAANGESSYFAWTNRGKESVTVDFKQADDAALLMRLLERADVFIQNLAPGALARAGFGSAALRERFPRLVTCDITGYGDSEAVGHLKAYDLLVQCEAGLVEISGSPDGLGRIGVSVCDIGAGMNASMSILAALALRERTGKGCGVSVSLFDGAAEWMAVPLLHEVYGNGAPGRVGLKHPSIAPYGAFSTQDGHPVVISIQNDREWQRFATDFLKQPDLGTDARFATNARRVANRDALEALIAASFGRLPLTEALRELSAANVAFGQVRTVRGLAEHPALRTTPMEVSGKRIDMVSSPIRGPWEPGHFRPTPSLGEQNEAIRAEFAPPSP